MTNLKEGQTSPTAFLAPGAIADDLKSVTSRSIGYRERDGGIWGMPKHGHQASLSPEQMYYIITANAGIAPLGWDAMPGTRWLTEPMGTATGVALPLRPPSEAHRISALEVKLAFGKLLSAFSELRASFTGLADAKTIRWFQTAAKRERARAKHFEKREARIACSWMSSQQIEELSVEAHQLADRFYFAHNLAVLEKKKKEPLVLLMEPLEAFFEKVFGMRAAGGWRDGRPDNGDPCEGPLNQAESAFINVAARFLETIGVPYKELTIQTALYDMRRKSHTKGMQDWFAQNGLDWFLDETDVRQVARHMTQGLTAEQALERFACEVYQAEKRRREA